MAELCGVLSSINANQGDPCNLGYTTGIIYSDVKNAAVAKAAAALSSTWTGAVTSLQMKDKTAGRCFVVKFAKATPGTTEVAEYVKDDGSTTVTNVTRGKGTFDVESGVCAMRSLLAFFENQKTGYVWLIKSSGAIVGQEITAGTTEQIKASVHAINVEGTTAEPDLIRMSISYLEKWEKTAVAILPEAGFEYLDLVESNVTDMTFTFVSSTHVQAVVDVTSPCGAAITDLSVTANVNTGNFKIYNNDTSANVAVTGISKSGNRYTLGFGTQAGDSVTIYYLAPSTTNEPYEKIQDNGLTITLPAAP
jgi:hypothetical protein